MEKLKAAGTAANRKSYSERGVGQKAFGVSFAVLEKMKNEIGTDQDLALKLWDAGYAEARLLATMIADPLAMAEKKIDAWLKEAGSYFVADSLAINLVGPSPLVRKKAEKWQTARNPLVSRTGWLLLEYLAGNDRSLPDSYFENYLSAIKGKIGGAPALVQEAMGRALAAIGGRSEGFRARALAVAERIGPVTVKYSDNYSRLFDAASLIKTGGRESSAP